MVAEKNVTTAETPTQSCHDRAAHRTPHGALIELRSEDFGDCPRSPESTTRSIVASRTATGTRLRFHVVKPWAPAKRSGRRRLPAEPLCHRLTVGGAIGVGGWRTSISPFISYSSSDKNVARWLFHTLYTYWVPRRIRGTPGLTGRYPNVSTRFWTIPCTPQRSPRLRESSTASRRDVPHLRLEIGPGEGVILGAP
jgi:hypothetical protein